MQQLTLVKSS